MIGIFLKRNLELSYMVSMNEKLSKLICDKEIDMDIKLKKIASEFECKKEDIFKFWEIN